MRFDTGSELCLKQGGRNEEAHIGDTPALLGDCGVEAGDAAVVVIGISLEPVGDVALAGRAKT